MKQEGGQSGMSILISVIIIASAVLIIAVNSAIIGQNELDTSISGSEGMESLANAETCAHEGLRRLKHDSAYLIDDLSLPLDGGSCTLRVTASSSDRLMKASSQVNGYYREINVNLAIASSSIAIYDWREY